VNELMSYLMAQARYRPVATAQFAAGELWRRRRLRRAAAPAGDPPRFGAENPSQRFAAFLPSAARQARAFYSTFPSAAKTVVAEADAIMQHRFTIFGKQFAAGAEIDWHCDWESGYRWPAPQPGATLRLVGAAAGADVKRPWELARFHHALALGKAYAVTRDARYAIEFAAQVRHFLGANPYPLGIHWAMPMEAAVRAANLATAAAFFVDAPELEADFWNELCGTLYAHGRFVAEHREWNPVARGNHYLSCVAGMIYCGALFEEHAEARGWLELGRCELVREMSAQVHEDGVAHEGSSGYHTFLTELFLSCALLLARRDGAARNADADLRMALVQSCGAAFTARLEKMFGFLAVLVAGRERPPIWGDSDDGRFLPLCGTHASAAAHLLAVGREILERDHWPGQAGCAACEEVFWRLGRPPVSNLKSQIPNPTSQRQSNARIAETQAESRSFSDSGFYFFSSPRLRGSIRCGPLGIDGWANHAHCDQLSVELCCDGRAVVVDPGSYVYSSDGAERNLFRSTRYHNTPVVEAAEQNRYWPGLLFRIVDDTRSRLLRWETGRDRIEFAGEHRGYRRLPRRASVERRFTLRRATNTLLVRDFVRGAGAAELEWNWHFAPGVALAPLDAHVAEAPPWAAADGIVPVTLLPRAVWQAGPLVLRIWGTVEISRMEIFVESGWVAPRYGQRLPAPVLRIQGEAELPVCVAFEFQV
jgi:hypothetical protein